MVMLRSREDRQGVSQSRRTFTSIETWKEFLKRWEDIDTEEEAIGLLHAGIDIPDRDENFKGRIAFYIQVSGYENNKVAVCAEQLIVSRWLKHLSINTIHISNRLEGAILVLEFLDLLRTSLLGAPYPRFVAEFLSGIHRVWSTGISPRYQQGAEYIGLQSHTPIIVRALCIWGMGHLLGTNVRRETIPYLKKHLDQNNPKAVEEVFMHLTDGCAPPPTLDSVGAVEISVSNAARALLKLEYWVGDGVEAKYDHRPSR